jgi:hypothetical protein
MSKNSKHYLDKLLQNCDSVCDLASEEAIQIVNKIRTLHGRRLDRMAKLFEKTEVDSVIDLETMLLTNRKFTRLTMAG